MKFVKSSLIALATLFVLFGGLIIASAFNPKVSEAIGNFLYSGRGAETNETVPQPTVESTVVAGTQETIQQESASGTLAESQQEPASGTSAESQQGQSGGTGNYGSARVSVNWNELYSDKASQLLKEEEEAAKKAVSTKYSAPDEKKVKVPSAVTGLSAYAEIKDQGETLQDDAAKKLTDKRDYGALGLNYQFDTEIYPYFGMLSEREKHVYRQIYANANELKTTFTPVEDVNASQLLNIFTAVCHDHPELFWMETAYGSKYNKYGICLQIELKYNDTSKNLGEALVKFERSVEEILLGARNLASDYEKEKYVHDKLLEQAVYNKSAAMNQSAYSALVNGQTVCAGYSRAFQYVMQKLGIPCYYVTGTAGESHAWNMIKLPDGYYNLDLTWDDASDNKYEYFNKTDEDYKNTHVRKGLSVNLPACNGGVYRTVKDEAGNVQTDAHLRKPEDVGFSENDVIKDIWSYYDNCYFNVMQNGVGHYTFQNVIEGDALYNEWQYNNQNNLHWSNYMNGALDELGATYCHIELEAEKLQNNRYLITHHITMGQ